MLLAPDSPVKTPSPRTRGGDGGNEQAYLKLWATFYVVHIYFFEI